MNWVLQLRKAIEEARQVQRHSLDCSARLLAAVIDDEFNRLDVAGYPKVTVADVEVLVTSGPRNFGSRYVDTGLRFYRAQDITADGQVTDDSAVYVEVPPAMTTRAVVQEGDVLVVITGATIGRSAHVHVGLPIGLVSQHVGLIRVDRTRLEPQFLHYAMLSPAWAGGQLNASRYGQGKPGLNLGNLRQLTVPLPPLHEQRYVVAKSAFRMMKVIVK